MKNLDIKTLTDIEYTAISDYDILGSWKVEKDGVEFEYDMHDLKVADNGDIMKPCDFTYEQSSYCDDSTGYNTVDDSTFEWTEYDVLIKKEELTNIIKETLNEDANFYLKLMDNGKLESNTHLKDFFLTVSNFTK